MGAVVQQLEQMNRAIAAHSAEVEAAKEAWLNAEDPQKNTDLKEVYEDAVEKEKQLLQDRRALYAMLPSPGHVLGSGQVVEQIQALYDALQEQNEKKLPVSLSKIDTITWQEVQHTAKLTIRIVDTIPVSRSKEIVDAFAWDDRIETAQSDRYLPHLRKSISLGGRDMDWVDAAKDPQLLTWYNGSETLGRKFKGTTDVVLADWSAIRTLQPQRRLRLLFGLKKAVEEADVI